jgi:pimeloyl-ACP methyl ester carboxylesterase
MNAIRYRKAEVDSLRIFYREAGRADAPTLLLLHGFPSAGHMFRDLIPLLADRLHLVAPDLPGFGQSDIPPRGDFRYTFDNLAEAIGRFTNVIGLKRFAIYIFDYGAPVGLRIAAKHPERIAAIISQNGNAYDEGLSEGWSPIQAYWREPTQANRDALRGFLAPESTHFQYTHGVADPSLVSPDGRSLDDYYLARPGVHEVQLDLLLDYASNIALYPEFHTYFRIYSRRFWRCGAKTTRSSCPREPKRSSATYRAPMFASSTPATSRWRRTARRSRPPFATSWTGRSV